MKKILSLVFALLMVGSVEAARSIEAGPIWSNDHAQRVCPRVCDRNDMDWQGQWWTTRQGQMSVCQCEDRYNTPRRPHRPRPGYGNDVRRFELDFNQHRVFRGENTIGLRRMLRDQYGINSKRFNLKKVVLVAKSARGRGLAYLTVGYFSSFEETINGNRYDFDSRGGFDRVRFRSPKRNSRGPWQLHLRGKIKIKKIILKLERRNRR